MTILIAAAFPGGGITTLSDPACEYEETLLKASPIFAASGLAPGL
ncbi:hypothetical protein [Zavarzinia compransoris]|nr:hypothetical protein [Zavarzinia compransoris]TDP48661.1 hypothetical protein DES42_10117 [Zavarzinia compransoris]